MRRIAASVLHVAILNQEPGRLDRERIEKEKPPLFPSPSPVRSVLWLVPVSGAPRLPAFCGFLLDRLSLGTLGPGSLWSAVHQQSGWLVFSPCTSAARTLHRPEGH